MKVKDVMTSQVEMIDFDASLNEAASKMQSLDIGVLPVREADRITGIITDRDIVIRGLAEDRDTSTTPVSEIMTREVVCCNQDEDLYEAAKLMEERQLHRLVILDHENQPVGILSTSDLALRAHDDHLVSEVVERISEPGHQKW